MLNPIPADFERVDTFEDDEPLPTVYDPADLTGYRRLCALFPATWGFVVAGPHAQDVSSAVAWLEANGGEEGVDHVRLPNAEGTIVEIRFKDEGRFNAFYEACVTARRAGARTPEGEPASIRRRSRSRKEADGAATIETPVEPKTRGRKSAKGRKTSTTVKTSKRTKRS